MGRDFGGIKQPWAPKTYMFRGFYAFNLVFKPPKPLCFMVLGANVWLFLEGFPKNKK